MQKHADATVLSLPLLIPRRKKKLRSHAHTLFQPKPMEYNVPSIIQYRDIIILSCFDVSITFSVIFNGLQNLVISLTMAKTSNIDGSNGVWLTVYGAGERMAMATHL